MKPTVKRAPRNKEHPYANIPKCFINDFSISLELKAILLYCFSRPDDWEYYACQLASIHKIGYRKLLRLLDEGIAAGYIMRIAKRKGSLLQGYDYLFDEEKHFSNNVTDMSKIDTPQTYVENDGFSETKQGSKHDDSNIFTDVSKMRHAEDEVLLSTEYLDTKDREIHNTTKSAAEAAELVHVLLSSIKKRDQYIKTPKPKSWEYDLEKLIRLDGRTKDEIVKVIAWVETDSFWKTNILSASSLRKNFPKLLLKMNESHTKERINTNRTLVLQAKQEHAQHLKHMSFDDKHVINTTKLQKTAFDLPTEEFKKAFAEMFGGRYDGV